MAISLNVSTPYITIGKKAVFNGVGGVEPYSYSILKGSGSIDSSSGVYTAVAKNLGEVTVKVVDANNAIATQKITIVHYLHLIAYIIQSELGLDSDQAYIYNQRIFTPKDDKLYVAVGLENTKPVSASKKFYDGVEYRAVSNFNTVKIDILSKSIEALIRKDEVVASLGSGFSQNVQTANSFKIGRIPSDVVNLSNVDGTAIPYRFNFRFNVNDLSLFAKDAPYYDGDTIAFLSKTGSNTILQSEDI